MKWLFATFALFVILVGALIVAPSFVDWNQYKGQALEQVANLTGHEIAIDGDVSLALLPSPRVYLEDVSVKDPSSTQQNKKLASFERLDVSLELMPLLQGQVAVNSIHLEKPQIALRKDAEGKFNFMTSKLEAMMGVAEAVPTGKSFDGEAPPVSFDEISVTDGTFTYSDVAAEQNIALSAINTELEAKSLQGPFEVEGDLLYGQLPVKMKAKTGKIDQKLQAFSLNLDASVGGAAVEYAGSVTLGDAPEIQGETALMVKSLSEFMPAGEGKGQEILKGPVAIKGIVTASVKQAAFKNATLELAGQKLDGDVEIGLAPISVKAAFEGNELVDLGQFIDMKGSNSKQSASNPLDMAKALPETLELPEMGEMKLSLIVPGLAIDRNVLKNIQMTARKIEKGFELEFNSGDMPGQGVLQTKTQLVFAEKSKSTKTGKDIYSGPSLNVIAKGQTQNLPVTVGAFTGLSGLPLVKDARKGVFDIQAHMSANGMFIDKGIVNMDDTAFSVEGSLQGQSGSSRSLAKVKVIADKLNLDSIMGGSGEPKAGDPLQGLKTLALPYDVDADLTVYEAVLQGYDIEGLALSASVRPNALNLNKVGATNFAGAAVNVSGAISDLKNMAGLDITASLDTADPYKFADALSIDTKSWPKNLGATKASVKATGNIETLDVDASVAALGGEVGMKGKVANPLTQMKISGLSVQAKHPNMSKAVDAFAPGALNFASLAKPMSVSADVSMEGKRTQLSNIKGDLAGATVNGSVNVDTSGSKPSIAGTFRVGDLVLKSGNKGSSAASVGRSSGTASGGKWSSAPMDTGWLHGMSANFDIAANSIVYETWDLSKPALKVTLDNGTLNITDLKAGLYDGQINSSGTLSSSAPGQALKVKMASQIDNINLGALATALSGSQRIQATGAVSLDFDVSGAGASQSALVSSLQGSANLSGSNVVMKGFDLAGLAGALMESNKPLPRVQQILNASTSGGETAFDTIQGAYAIQNGVVGITSMAMDGPEAQIASAGNVSLPRWYMDTTHTVTLKNAPDVAPFDVEIKGSLDNPGNTFGSGLFDTFIRQRLQQKVVDELPDLFGDDVTDKLQKFGILPQKAEPAAGEPSVPANDNNASAQTQEQPQQRQQQEIKPEDVVNDLLKGFLQ